MSVIIPAMDIIEGKCVRLVQGNFNLKKVYDTDPLDMAKYFEDQGFQHLHVVDLDGARKKTIINWKILESITKNTSLKVDFGGGIYHESDINLAFQCGTQQVTVGSIAALNENLTLSWLKKYGSDKIILGADTRNEKICISGWQEETQLDLIGFLSKYYEKGIQYTICTDIQRDGALQGPAINLYHKIKLKLPGLYLIASGGVSTIADIHTLNRLGVEGIIIGKALYEGKIKVQDLKVY